MVSNYALFSIPLYMVMAMVPHTYATVLIVTNNNGKWDMASPRSVSNKMHTEKSVPKSCYRKFERCRAAHDNMLENMGFVVGGILSGVFTRLDADWMNMMCALYIASRVLYIISYVQIGSQRLSPLRSVWYILGSILIVMMYSKAGMAILNEGKLQ